MLAIGKILLIIPFVGILPMFALMLTVLVKNRTWNIEHIWTLAVRGDRLARIYMVVACTLFLSALLGALLSAFGL